MRGQASEEITPDVEGGSDLGQTSLLQRVTVLALTAAACAVYMFVGPSLVILNKHIMQDCHFNYPLTLVAFGFTLSSMIARMIAWCKPSLVRHSALEVFAGRGWFRIALPIGFCSALAVAPGNAAYLYLGLGFIQMLKALNPAVVLIVMRLSGLVGQPNVTAVCCVLVIIAGTALEIKGELHANIVGLLLMLLSETCEAIRLVMQQWLLQNQRLTVLECMHSLAPPAAMCLLAVALPVEGPRLLERGDIRIVKQHALEFLLQATLSVGVNFVGVIVIQATSALSSKVLNALRCVGLVFMGTTMYGEQSTAVQVAGYALALVGFAGYNFAQVYPERVRTCLDAPCAEPAQPANLTNDRALKRAVKFSMLPKAEPPSHTSVKVTVEGVSATCGNLRTPADGPDAKPLPTLLGAATLQKWKPHQLALA